ncbi:carbonic anhydrase [Streptomyces sp. NBC_00687]|uniref:carbonic anhydrase n=1 Tax=Streptomyces sp. NBC_00687 TaxID=2975807 RepID=UPI002252171E|nr:carbonic anhydrase [Streptomyces sp. NBC_00687]MCX4920026.1 carbonic anhydrase [Streptomyces sp. NBC_00687]
MEFLIKQARDFPARAAAHGLDLNTDPTGRPPRALFITCSDPRVVPALITGSRPGDLVELRTYGGLIPSHDKAGAAEARTIAHAVEKLEVSDIVVCGHSRCDVVDAAVGKKYPPSIQTVAGQWHTLTQLDALSDYPHLIARVAGRSLRLHAWFYDVDTGDVFHYTPRANAFLPL